MKSYIYILTNKNKTVLYIGVTSNLQQRLQQHRQKLIPSFTKKYNVEHLIYFESYPTISAASTREKQLKSWIRLAKERLIEKINPKWNFINAG